MQRRITFILKMVKNTKGEMTLLAASKAPRKMSGLITRYRGKIQPPLIRFSKIIQPRPRLFGPPFMPIENRQPGQPG